MIDANIVSILLDIKEQNGAMGAQLHEASRTRERLEESMKALSQKMDMIDHRTDTIETQQIAVTETMTPLVKDVANLKILTGKFTAIWGAGFAVMAWALAYFSNEIHTFLFPGRQP